MVHTPKSLPLLEALCWNLANPYTLSESEMLGIYESNWHFKGVLAEPSGEETKFIAYLTSTNKGLPLIEQSSNMNKFNLYEAIETILSYLNAELLIECEVYLAGGALVNLQNQEKFRYSQDLDFLCKSEGFYRLRQRLANNIQNCIFKPNTILEINSARFDRYAIRFPVYLQQNETEISLKIEFVVEDSLSFDPAEFLPNLSIPCLNRTDLIAAKLLANYDRGLDKSKFSRDLIDLAMMRTTAVFPQASFDKATMAYRLNESITNSLIETITFFQKDSTYRAKTYQQLQIDRPVKIMDGIDLLAQDLGLQITARTFQETDFSYLE
jgi:hypothetical protein